MRLAHCAFCALLPALLAGCNAASRIPGLGVTGAQGPSAHFEPSEAAFIRRQGAATIQGHAFLRDKSGQTNVRYAAGEIVRLIPATAYARARFAHFYGGAKFVPAAQIPKIDPDPTYAAYTRTTKADASGRFVFDHVAPGNYFVATQLIWKPKDSLLSEGGAMYEEAIVADTDSGPVKIVVSGN